MTHITHVLSQSDATLCKCGAHNVAKSVVRDLRGASFIWIVGTNTSGKWLSLHLNRLGMSSGGPHWIRLWINIPGLQIALVRTAQGRKKEKKERIKADNLIDCGTLSPGINLELEIVLFFVHSRKKASCKETSRKMFFVVVCEGSLLPANSKDFGCVAV